MSYTILYDTQFIKTSTGILPLVLMGESNVYESTKGNAARSRHWSVLDNMLDVTADEFLAKVAGWDADALPWKRNGKFMTPKSLMRWAETSCKNAATLEEFRVFNAGSGGLDCGVVRYPKEVGAKPEFALDAYVISTAMLDEWLAKYRAYVDQYTAAGDTVLPRISFLGDNIKHVKPLPDKVIFRKRSWYLIADIDDSAGEFVWKKDIRLAKQFERNDAFELQRRYMHLQGSKVSIIPAPTSPYNCVLQFTGGAYAGSFISKVSPKNIRTTQFPGWAKHYANEAAAMKAKKKLEKRLSVEDAYWLAVVTDNKD